MTNQTVFDEPSSPHDGPIRGWAEWCRLSTAPEAAEARRIINGWHERFPPNRSEMVLSRLQGPDDTNFLQTVDELHVHDLLSRSYEVRYEEDGTSADFRLYRASQMVASVEVCTLFPNKAFMDEVARNERLTSDINARVKSKLWWAAMKSIVWHRQPSAKAIAEWLTRTMADLPDLEPETGDPWIRIYSTPDVEISFSFRPRSRSTESETPAPVIAIGPPVFGRPGSETRLRGALTKKAGQKYDNRDKPFAIFVSARDWCDTEDFVNAIYGSDAIAFTADSPGSAHRIRYRNGFFAMSRNNATGRNRRTSCVFGLLRGWLPGTPMTSTVVRFDNPFALTSFPDDIVTTSSQLRPHSDETGVAMVWAPAS